MGANIGASEIVEPGSGILGNMDAKTRGMVEFVEARIAEDRAIARAAHRRFAVEATAQTATAEHARFLTRFDPQWVTGECARKEMLVRAELLQGTTLEKVPGGDAYSYPNVTLLASAWLTHPAYDDAWT